MHFDEARPDNVWHCRELDPELLGLHLLLLSTEELLDPLDRHFLGKLRLSALLGKLHLELFEGAAPNYVFLCGRGPRRLLGLLYDLRIERLGRRVDLIPAVLLLDNVQELFLSLFLARRLQIDWREFLVVIFDKRLHLLEVTVQFIILIGSQDF